MPEAPLAGMTALVTNDDGIDSEGLHELARACERAGLEVTVAAPLADCSGASASIMHRRTGNRVAVETRAVEGVRGRCLAVDGNPGFIALIGSRGAFGVRPDLVVSGVNRGWNTGHVVMHSGTVGAALSAAVQGCRGLAVSTAYRPSPRWDTAAQVAAAVLPFLAASRRGTALNLNVPDIDLTELRGLRWAPLAPFGTVQTVAAQLGAGHLELSIDDPLTDLPADTDAALVADGYATVTALAPVAELGPLGELPALAGAGA